MTIFVASRKWFFPVVLDHFRGFTKMVFPRGSRPFSWLHENGFSPWFSTIFVASRKWFFSVVLDHFRDVTKMVSCHCATAAHRP
jgi:hypothetical protein